MVKHLDSFCLCCSLRTGSVAIGVIGCAAAVCSFVTSVVCSEEKSGPLLQSFNKTTVVGGSGAGFCSFYAFVSIIQMMLNGMLVFGAAYEVAKLLKPWIVAAVITAAVGGVVNIVHIIIMLASGLVEQGVIAFTIFIFGMSMSVYFILVVNSFHTKLALQHVS